MFLTILQCLGEFSMSAPDLANFLRMFRSESVRLFCNRLLQVSSYYQNRFYFIANNKNYNLSNR